MCEFKVGDVVRRTADYWHDTVEAGGIATVGGIATTGFTVKGEKKWGFEYNNGFNLVDEQGVSLILDGDRTWVSIQPAIRRVSLGKKKVLVPVT